VPLDPYLPLNCLFLYRNDGSYPIDNNLAERQVRPFTALRKVVQHYGGDEGAETVAIYLSVVSTVKLAKRAGVAFPRRLLRGRGDIRTAAYWSYEAVARIE